MQTIGSRPARQAASALARTIASVSPRSVAALGMAHDHVARAGILQHLGRDVAGMGAARLGVAVLAANQQRRPLDRLGHWP